EDCGKIPVRETPLPAVRGEHDVDIAYQRPDNVIGSKTSRCITTNGSPLSTCNRRPYHQVNDWFGDHADHIKVLSNTILEPTQDRRLHCLQVKVEHVFHVITCSCVKTCSITSSMGGSSIVRSVMEHSLSRRDVMRAASVLGTRSLIISASRSITAP